MSSTRAPSDRLPATRPRAASTAAIRAADTVRRDREQRRRASAAPRETGNVRGVDLDVGATVETGPPPLRGRPWQVELATAVREHTLDRLDGAARQAVLDAPPLHESIWWISRHALSPERIGQLALHERRLASEADDARRTAERRPGTDALSAAERAEARHARFTRGWSGVLLPGRAMPTS